MCVGVIKAMMLPAVLLTTLSAGLLASCSSDNKNSEFANQGELLYSIGDSSLSVASVVAQIPPGLDPQDSIALFRAIADAGSSPCCWRMKHNSITACARR